MIRGTLHEFRLHVFLLAALCSAGCTTIRMGGEHTAIALANIKSPLTVRWRDVRPLNDPLDISDRLAIENAATSTQAGMNQQEALSQAWGETVCVPHHHYGKFRRHLMRIGYQYECADNFQDLVAKETLVIVAIAGGGTRAATLARHTMSLLEQRYDEVRSMVDLPAGKRLRPMFLAVDAYSTVSGGSLYAFWLSLVNQAADPSRSNLTKYKDPDNAVRKLLGEEPQDNCCSESLPCCEKEPFFAEPLEDAAMIPDDESSPAQEPSNTPTPSPGGTAQPASPSPTLVYLPQYERLFQRMDASPETDTRTLYPGWTASKMYLLPQNLLLPFVLTFGSDRSFTDVLSVGIDTNPYWGPLATFMPWTHLGDLPWKPRFYFNATALETASPFVITRNISQLPIGHPVAPVVRVDHPDFDELCRQQRRPFCHSLTLEDLASSPAAFPLAYAAAASAAYPAGFEPVPLRKYQFDRTKGQIEETTLDLHLVDGGVYDNSGLTTAMDFFQYMVTTGYPKTRHLVLIAISADAVATDEALQTRMDTAASLFPVPVGYDFPLASAVYGVKSVDLIHETNKRRSENVAGRRIDDLRDYFKKESYNQQGYPPGGIDYFPIHLTQLSQENRDHVVVTDPTLYERVKKIDTDLVLSPAQDAEIKEAALALVNAKQLRNHNLWAVGPNCGGDSPTTIDDVGTAVAFDLIRAQADSWNDQVEIRASEWARAPWCRQTNGDPNTDIDHPYAAVPSS
jgi:predicted acylesterase/phospholipase RssA